MLVALVKDEESAATAGIPDDKIGLADVRSASVETQEEMLPRAADAPFLHGAGASAIVFRGEEDLRPEQGCVHNEVGHFRPDLCGARPLLRSRGRARQRNQRHAEKRHTPNFQARTIHSLPSFTPYCFPS